MWEETTPGQGSVDLWHMGGLWGRHLTCQVQFHCEGQPAPGTVQKEHIKLWGWGAKERS